MAVRVRGSTEWLDVPWLHCMPWFPPGSDWGLIWRGAGPGTALAITPFSAAQRLSPRTPFCPRLGQRFLRSAPAGPACAL